MRRRYNGNEALPIDSRMNPLGTCPQSDDGRGRHAERDRAGADAAAILPNAMVRCAVMGRPVVHALHVFHAVQHGLVPKEHGPDEQHGRERTHGPS